MDLIKIIDEHTKTALRQAEELQQIIETTEGYTAIQNERAKQMLQDSQSILSQVLQSLDGPTDEPEGPTKIIRPDPEVWR